MVFQTRPITGMLVKTVGRWATVVSAAILAACSPAAPPVRSTPPEATKQPWYGETVQELAALNNKATRLFETGKSDDAAALIQKGEPLMSRVLSVPKPTLGATEAASDLDQLYGRMLLSNRHYGWARLMFQKNLARWKHWEPQTPETLRRRKEAESSIAECDRHIGE